LVNVLNSYTPPLDNDSTGPFADVTSTPSSVPYKMPLPLYGIYPTGSPPPPPPISTPLLGASVSFMITYPPLYPLDTMMYAFLINNLPSSSPLHPHSSSTAHLPLHPLSPHNSISSTTSFTHSLHLLTSTPNLSHPNAHTSYLMPLSSPTTSFSGFT